MRSPAGWCVVCVFVEVNSPPPAMPLSTPTVEPETAVGPARGLAGWVGSAATLLCLGHSTFQASALNLAVEKACVCVCPGGGGGE